jgi:hypothetical protein
MTARKHLIEDNPGNRLGAYVGRPFAAASLSKDLGSRRDGFVASESIALKRFIKRVERFLPSHNRLCVDSFSPRTYPT